MSKFETVCPHCRKPNTVEKTSFGAAGTEHGQQDIQCSHCSKRWKEDLGESGSLTKSAPTQSPEMATLRERVAELAKVLQAFIDRQAAARAAAPQSARFNVSGREVEKSDGDVRELLDKALEHGTRVDVAHPETNRSAGFQTVESIGVGVRTAPGGRFAPDGFESNDVAKAELAKALRNGRPMGFTPRGN
jgi:hypothetical protein